MAVHSVKEYRKRFSGQHRLRLIRRYLCSLQTNISERPGYPKKEREAGILAAAQPMDPREIETLQYYLKEYGQQAEVFAGQLELMENGRMEALAAIEALETLATSEDGTVLLQIGGGASLKAKVLEPEKVLLNIGSEVILEKTNADAVGYLKDRITEMEASQKKVAEALDKLRTQMNEIAKRLEQGYRQASGAAGPVPHGHDHEDNDEE
jgi:prefoldin alpha subunit